MPEQNTEEKQEKQNEAPKKDGVFEKVLSKINDAENVLIALSDNPSVDEMASAIGLTMVLDSVGKHATAIYSGKTPNVLEFLKPQETFEVNTDSLQDFIIALNKEKADHLRYKVDGDFVKVYITPYRTTINEDDLEFSRGDFNVDLVVALNVAAATDLDGALREHGRIMHDASAINITTGAPGKFGEVEWSDPAASSISEMVANLAFKLQKDLDKGAATALLTGLVAATDRFSNELTSPSVMVLAAKLMGAGADQQLVAANISGKVSFDETGEIGGAAVNALQKNEDKSKLSIDHVAGAASNDVEKKEEKEEATIPTIPMSSDTDSEALPVEQGQDQASTDGVAIGGVGLPEAGNNVAPDTSENIQELPKSDNPNMIAGVEIGPSADNSTTDPMSLADQMVQQITGQPSTLEPAGEKDYGKMIDEALAEPLPGEGGIQVGANTANGPMTDVQDVSKVESGPTPTITSMGEPLGGYQNPAAGMAPEVAGAPVVNNIPDMSFGNAPAGAPMNFGTPSSYEQSTEFMEQRPGMGNTAEGGESYLMNAPEKVLNPVNAEPVPVPSDLPMPGQDILPPPPTPPIDFSMANNNPMPNIPVPEMPQVQVNGMPDMNNPMMAQQQPNVPVQGGQEPGAFQIPGQGF